MALTEIQTTYFGLWSKRKLEQVTALLDGLGARYEVMPEDGVDQKRLEDWCAWDASAENPNEGYHLDIWSEDLPKVSDKIVSMFPERKFGG